MSEASKYDGVYPVGEEISPFWAYGFRPFFLILPWYIALITILWGVSFAGVVPIPPFSEPLLWHIYELLYGVGFAGIAAFLLTGVPELFPGTVPLVGRKLQYLVILWILGRVSFWLVGILSPYPAAIFNISFSVILIMWAFKPVVLDSLQRHASLAYFVVILTLLQAGFFASISGFGTISPNEWLFLSLGTFMGLILLALRRVQNEAINESMEDRGIEDLFMPRPFRYNLAVFCILLFSVCELFGDLSTAGWLAFASAAAILGCINDYRLRFERILHLPYSIVFITIFLLMSLGYGLFGVSCLFELSYFSHARHVLSIGVFGGAFLAVMIVVGFVHTGRRIVFDKLIAISILMLMLSLCFRLFVELLGAWAYGVSAVLFAASFLIYYYRFRGHLSSIRADGIPG